MFKWVWTIFSLDAPELYQSLVFFCGAGYTSDCKHHKWAKKYHKNPNEPSLKIASKPKHNI